METRELYKQKYEAQIHEWSAKIEALQAHADKLTAEAKIDAKPHLDTLHSKLEAAKAKLEEIAQATDDKWDDVRKAADHAWEDFKASIAGAYDVIKPGKPGKGG
jgi:predicted  nucleic acid-binding Zn-ribbon protein